MCLTITNQNQYWTVLSFGISFCIRFGSHIQRDAIIGLLRDTEIDISFHNTVHRNGNQLSNSSYSGILSRFLSFAVFASKITTKKKLQ